MSTFLKSIASSRLQMFAQKKKLKFGLLETHSGSQSKTDLETQFGGHSETQFESRLKNQTGSALVHAILVSTIIIVTSGVIFQQSLETQRLNKYPRIKSTELIAETTIKTWALQPSSYSNCGTAGLTCEMQKNLIDGKRFVVRGAQCPSSTDPCGFVVQEPIFFPNDPWPASSDLPAPTGSGYFFRFFLQYEGTEIRLKRKEVLMKVPPESLHTNEVTCPSSAPIFTGFDDQGIAQCEALPTQSQCPVGQYATATDLGQLRVTCQPISINNSTCGADQLISSIEWNNGVFNVTCEPRTNAFTFANRLSGFNPSASSLAGGPAVGPRIINPADVQDAPRPDNTVHYDSCCTPSAPSCAPGVCSTSLGTVSDGCGGNRTVPGCETCAGPINGACGGADGGAFADASEVNAAQLCSAGSAPALTGLGPWSWTCSGSGGGTSAPCSATLSLVPVNGSCGGAAGGSFASATDVNNAGLCAAGTSPNVSGSGPWSWTCSGSGGGTNAPCTATSSAVPVNGLCGGANGLSFATATDVANAGLCITGTSSALSGSGPWSWSCDGADGGTNAPCSALRCRGDGEMSGMAGALNACPNVGFDKIDEVDTTCCSGVSHCFGIGNLTCGSGSASPPPCQASGYTTQFWGGYSEDTPCNPPGSNVPNSVCCSGTHSATYPPGSFVGGTSCTWTCD